MAKFLAILACLAITLVAVQAELPRFRVMQRNGALRQPVRFLARQEAAPPTLAPSATGSAPYPAAGVTPEVPFELPTETTTPSTAYGPPPEPSYGPPAAEPSPVQPENSYGPPTAAGGVAEPAPVGEPVSDVENVNTDVVSQNLIQPRQRVRFERLRATPRFNVPQGNILEIVRSEPVFVYTLS